MTFAHKCQIQQQQEARLNSVLALPRIATESFKQHMIRNGYKPLPRNKYEDLVITMPASYYFLSIRSV